MKIQKFGCIAVALSLVGTPALADDAHHADHGATAAKPAAAPKSDAQPPAAVVEAAVASKEEASAKPAPRKHKRKKQKAEAKPSESGKQQEAAHADAGHTDAHAVPVPAPIAPAARVRVKDRAAAASAVAAAQAADAQSDHAASADPAAPDAHASHHAAASDAPAAAAAAAAPHDAHDAPPVPAAIEPTRRARVKASMAAMPVPVPAPVSAVEVTTADATMADAHGAVQMAEASAPAKTDAVPDAAPAVAETRAADECNPPLKGEVAALFDRWNASLRTGDPKKVVANYAPDSVLLPTVSNRARFTVAEKEDYFMHFLQRRPQGYIDDRMIDVDCNSATDAGLYTFRFADGTSVKARYSFAYRKINGQWLITSHHSSGMPEKPEAPVAHSADPQPVTKSAESAAQNKGWVRFP